MNPSNNFVLPLEVKYQAKLRAERANEPVGVWAARSGYGDPYGYVYIAKSKTDTSSDRRDIEGYDYTKGLHDPIQWIDAPDLILSDKFTKKKYKRDLPNIDQMSFIKQEAPQMTIASNKIKMTKEDSLEYLTYRILKNEYLSLCETNTLEQINRDSFYQQYETIDSLNYQMITLAKQYLVDKKIVDNFKELTDFGYLRNNYMAQKIKGILKAHGNKRIFVIVGNAHKYYLVNHLKKEDELEITWDSLSNF